MLETGAGLIPVEVSGTRVTMTQVAPHFGVQLPAEMVAAVGDIAADDIIHPPQIVSTGLPFCITLLRSRDVLERVVVQRDAFITYAEAYGDGASDLMEPFWAT